MIRTLLNDLVEADLTALIANEVADGRATERARSADTRKAKTEFMYHGQQQDYTRRQTQILRRCRDQIVMQ